MKLDRVLETVLYARDLAAAEKFYTKLLEREPYVRDAGRLVFYKLEEAMFLLFNPDVTTVANPGLPLHGTTGQGHACFRIEEGSEEAWKERLEKLGVPVEMEHTWPNDTKSIYFRDPAGNSLELACWRIWNRYD